MAGLDAFTSRAFDMVASGGVRNALDLNREDAKRPRALSGRRAVPDRPPPGRSGRRLRHPVHRRLGHARPELPDPASPAAAGRPRHRQPDPGPARPRPGRRRRHGHVGRVRPHAAHQQQRRPRPLGAGHVAPWSPAAACAWARPSAPARPAANVRKTAATPCRRCSRTLYRAIGIDPALTFPNGTGRPMYIARRPRTGPRVGVTTCTPLAPQRVLAATQDSRSPELRASPRSVPDPAWRSRASLGLSQHPLTIRLPAEHLTLTGRFHDVTAAWPGVGLPRLRAAARADEPAKKPTAETDHAAHAGRGQGAAGPPDQTSSSIGGDDSRQLDPHRRRCQTAGCRTSPATSSTKSPTPRSSASPPPAASSRWPTARPPITASYGDKTRQRRRSRPSRCDVDLPINFANHIVPIFTKLGCNSGGCHGKSGGQNGFAPVAARLRARARLPDAGQGKPRPAPLPRRARAQPAAAEGDRQHGPRRRQAHGARLRRVQAHPPLDRLRHALRQPERPDRHQDHASTPSTASSTRQQPPAVRRLRPLHRRHRRGRHPAGPVREQRHRHRRRRRHRPGPHARHVAARRRSWPATRARSPSSAPPCRSA